MEAHYTLIEVKTQGGAAVSQPFATAALSYLIRGVKNLFSLHFQLAL